MVGHRKFAVLKDSWNDERILVNAANKIIIKAQFEGDSIELPLRGAERRGNPVSSAKNVDCNASAAKTDMEP